MNHSLRNLPACCAVAFYFWSIGLGADTLIYRSGQKVEGKMVHINGFRLLFRLQDGREISVPAGQVSRILFGKRAPEPRKIEKPPRPAPNPAAKIEKPIVPPARREPVPEIRNGAAAEPAPRADRMDRPPSPPRGTPAKKSERVDKPLNETRQDAPANLFQGERSAAAFEADTLLLARRPVKVSLNVAGASEETLIRYSLNDGEFVKYAGPFTLSETGLYQIRYFAVDAAGNREVQRQRTIQIDRGNPEMRFEFAGAVFRDRQGVVFTGTPFVFVRAEDPHSGMAGVRCHRAGETVDLAQEGGMFAIEGHDRTITVVCQARDRVGNQAERTLYVRHDGTPPRVGWGSTDADRFFSAGARISFFANDEGSGIGTLNLLVDGFTHELSPDARSFAPADFESRPGAEREFVIIAVDRTGNEARSPALRLRVDTRAPVSELKIEP